MISTQASPQSKLLPEFFTPKEGEQFHNVEILTTRADYAEQLFNHLTAQIELTFQSTPNTEAQVRQALRKIHDDGIVRVCESVEIYRGRIKIVVNAAEVDDQAVAKALRYLAKTVEESRGEDTYRVFSPTFAHEAHELFWLFTQ